jgi:hypothetical protein
MKSIVVTYPYFQSLPKGLKMLLVESEGFFFRENGSAPAQPASGSKATRMDRNDVLRFRPAPRNRREPHQSDSQEQSLSE